MKNFFKSMAVFVRALPHFLLFEFLYKLILTAAGAPLLALILKLTMKASGINYLSDESMMVYLKNPITLAFIVILLFCSGFFAFVELSALAACFTCYSKHEKITVGGMLLTGFRSFPQSVQRNWHTSFCAFHALYALCTFHTVLRYVFSSASSYFKKGVRQHQRSACYYMLRSDTVSFYFYHCRKKLQPALSCSYEKKIL